MVVLVVVMASCNSEVWQVTVSGGKDAGRGSGGKGSKRWWPW